MKDKTGFFAALSDSLCCVCVYWVVASTMIMAGRGWTLGLFWPLLWTVLCALVFARMLATPRGFNAMLTYGAVAAALGLGLFIALSGVSMTALHVFTLAVGAGMAAGLPIYYLVKRPTVHGHLTCIDVLLLAFAWLLLAQAGQGVQVGAAALTAAVLVLAVGAAVGLRMGAESGAEGTKAMAVALGAAAVLTLVVLALIALFSRSGALTGSIVGAIGEALRSVGRFIGSLAERFAALFDPIETETVAIPVEGDAAGIYAETAEVTAAGEMSVWVKLIAVALVVAAVAAVMLILRKTKLTVEAETVPEGQNVRTHSLRQSARTRWAAWMRALNFRITAHLRRDTPPGVLVYAERHAARQKKARRSGETARQFLHRLAPDGALDALADDLDRRWYGKRKYTLTAAECRALRQKINER